MKAKLTATLDRIYPGMGWRPLWLTIVAAVALVIYEHHGSRRSCPAWFIEQSRAFFEIEPLRFHQHLWSHLTAFATLMVLPILCGFLLERWSIWDLGLSVRNAKKEFLLVLALWAAFLPVLWFFSETPAFMRTYPRLPGAATDLSLYAWYEGLYLIKWVAWEFFFRGFLLFGLAKDFGTRAVLFSTLPFVIMHFGKPEAEVAASLAAGFILCTIALRSKSIWPGVLLHWLVASSMDFFASSFWR